MTFKDKSFFPLKKCLIASVVIILCYLMVFTLLYAIVYSTDVQPFAYIFFIVWGSLLGLSLLAYWIYQICQYRKKRKDEKEG